MDTTEATTFHNKLYDSVPLTAFIAFYWIIKEDDEYENRLPWIDWANQLLQAGYSYEEIIKLSQITNSQDQIKIKGLINIILDKLHVDLNDIETILKYYCMYIIRQGIAQHESVFSTLEQIENLFQKTNFYLFYDFHILYYAYKELREEGVQDYWKDLALQNKDEYINLYFKKWLQAPESQLYTKWKRKSTFRQVVESIFCSKYAGIFYFIISIVSALLLYWLFYTLYPSSIISQIIIIGSFTSFIINVIFQIIKIRNKIKNK